MEDQDDYGYFGDGDEGYAHYIAASGEDGAEENDEGGHQRVKVNNGCLVAIFIALVIVAIIKALD